MSVTIKRKYYSHWCIIPCVVLLQTLYWTLTVITNNNFSNNPFNIKRQSHFLFHVVGASLDYAWCVTLKLSLSLALSTWHSHSWRLAIVSEWECGVKMLNKNFVSIWVKTKHCIHVSIVRQQHSSTHTVKLIYSFISNFEFRRIIFKCRFYFMERWILFYSLSAHSLHPFYSS